MAPIILIFFLAGVIGYKFKKQDEETRQKLQLEKDRERVKAEKEAESAQKEQKELEEFKQSFDSFIGDRFRFIAIKGDRIYLDKDRYFDNLHSLCYVMDETLSNNRHFLLITPDHKIYPKFLDGFKQDQLKYLQSELEKHKIKRLNMWFFFPGRGEFQPSLNANKLPRGYLMYKTNEQSDWFYFSDAKDNSKWYLTNIDYQPKYVTDYDVNTTIHTEGNMSGRAGSAIVGGLLAGPAGAMVGASMGRKIDTTSTTTNTQMATQREIPSAALLFFKDEKNKEVRLDFMMNNSQVLFLKKNFMTNRSEPKKESLIDELRDLKLLVEEGILTEEEFARKKAKILDI